MTGSERQPLDDNDLLDFPASGLAMSDAGDARRLLHQHGDVFRAQLVAARWLDGYRLRRLSDFDHLEAAIGARHSREHERGFDEAMRDIIAHLRQGDFLPGGTLYEDEIRGSNDPHPSEGEWAKESGEEEDEPPRRQSREW